MRRIVCEPQYWPQIAEFVAGKIGSSRNIANFSAIGILNGDRLIAGVVYSEFNGRNITAGIAGEGRRWLTPEFLWFMFYYPFVQAGARRITACVEQTNVVSQQFVEKLGFELEFSMKEAGKTGDMLIYRMFREDCRYLERRHGRKQTS